MPSHQKMQKWQSSLSKHPLAGYLNAGSCKRESTPGDFTIEASTSLRKSLSHYLHETAYPLSGFVRSFIFNRRIINTLNQYSAFNITAYADTLLSKVNVQINRQWQKTVSSAGAVNSLQVMAIYPLTENLILRCNIRGELAIRIDDIDF